MNTTTSNKISVLVMSLAFFMLTLTVNANQGIKEWYGNQNFTFSENQNELFISINKKPWESFTLKIDNFELMNNPVVNMQIKADQDIILRIDVSDGTFVSSETEIIQKFILSSDSFNDLDFDFSSVLSHIDLSEETYLIFYVNPGKEFNGQIAINEINFLKEIENSTLNEGNNTTFENALNIFPTPATSVAFIEIPDGSFSFLKIFDITANEVLSLSANGIEGSDFNVDVNDLKDGCYIVKLIGSNHTFTGKLVIQK